MTATSRRQTFQLAAVLAGGALALSACGSGSTAEADVDNELATLETSTGPDASASSDSGPAANATDVELSSDEAALALSECLRGEGLDLPDIGVDADGNIDLRGAFQDLGPGNESLRVAMAACRDVLEGVGFGGGRGALADNTEIQDAFLEFSDCIRSEGFEDVPDLAFGAPGQGPGGTGGAPTGAETDGDGPGPGRGNREGGFGDRSSLIAERLGLDPEDPEVIAALDECRPIIEQAFSDAGVGQPGNGA